MIKEGALRWADTICAWTLVYPLIPNCDHPCSLLDGEDVYLMFMVLKGWDIRQRIVFPSEASHSAHDSCSQKNMTWRCLEGNSRGQVLHGLGRWKINEWMVKWALGTRWYSQTLCLKLAEWMTGGRKLPDLGSTRSPRHSLTLYLDASARLIARVRPDLKVNKLGLWIKHYISIMRLYWHEIIYDIELFMTRILADNVKLLGKYPQHIPSL